jgi:hypothetical protein
LLKKVLKKTKDFLVYMSERMKFFHATFLLLP